MNKKIGKIIREIRNEKGLSLRKLAEIVGVSNVNILYIEKGKINTSLPILKGIAKGLNYNKDFRQLFFNILILSILLKNFSLFKNALFETSSI